MGLMKKLFRIVCLLLFISVSLIACTKNKAYNQGEREREVTIMKKKITVKNDFSDKLIGTISAHEDDVAERSMFSGNKKIENKIGVKFPDDYCLLLNRRIDLDFSDIMYIANPFTDEDERYFDEYNDCMDNLDDIRKMRREYYGDDSVIYLDQDNKIQILSDIDNETEEFYDILKDGTDDHMISCGRGFPFQNFDRNTKVGLVYWGNDDNFTFYFNYYTDNYTIVLYGDGDDFYEYDSSFSEFLYNLSINNIKLFF